MTTSNAHARLFPHLDGLLRISGRSNRSIEIDLSVNPEFGDLWNTIALFGERETTRYVTLQYTPGPSGREAGSAWTDFTDGAHLADTVTDDYLRDIEAGFAAGHTFVP